MKRRRVEDDSTYLSITSSICVGTPLGTFGLDDVSTAFSGLFLVSICVWKGENVIRMARDEGRRTTLKRSAYMAVG
jgi:hypothetical protein